MTSCALPSTYTTWLSLVAKLIVSLQPGSQAEYVSCINVYKLHSAGYLVVNPIVSLQPGSRHVIDVSRLVLYNLSALQSIW
jgi:hypothetical protein